MLRNARFEVTNANELFHGRQEFQGVLDDVSCTMLQSFVACGTRDPEALQIVGADSGTLMKTGLIRVNVPWQIISCTAPYLSYSF